MLGKTKIAAAGAGAVMLVACGSGGQRVAVVSVAHSPTVAPQASSAFLTASSDRTAAVSSGRYSMAFSFVGVPGVGSFSFTVAGAFDAAQQRSLMSMDYGAIIRAASQKSPADAALVTALLGDGQFEIITDGTKAYLRFGLFKLLKPDLSKTWVVVDASVLGADRAKLMNQFGGGAGALDHETFLAMLKGAGADVRTVGTEDVMGTSTTHYGATVSLAALLSASPPADAAKLKDRLAALGLSAGTLSIPTDVWVDDHGVVRRLTMTLSGFDPSAPAAAMKIDLTLYAVGQTVTIDPPPASDVQSIGDLKSLLKN